MNLVVLTAGKATRLGALAPHGCKALLPVAGRPMIDWQTTTARPERVTIVARPDYPAELCRYGDVIEADGGGPARALDAAFDCLDFPIVVAYADTWFTELPSGTDWCGVADAQGGRYWDVAETPIVYRYVRPDLTVKVCVGLYRYDDGDRLAHAIEGALINTAPEIGMGPVLNRYRTSFVDVPSWQDVGDPDALARFAQPQEVDV